MPHHFRRLFLAFWLAVFYSLICSLFAWAVAHGWSQVHWAVAADLLSPFVQLLAVYWLVEAKTWSFRVTLCGVTGVGYAIGTVVVLWWFGR